MGLGRIFWLGVLISRRARSTVYGVLRSINRRVLRESSWVKTMPCDLPDWRVVGERSGAQCRSRGQLEARVD